MVESQVVILSYQTDWSEIPVASMRGILAYQLRHFDSGFGLALTLD